MITITTRGSFHKTEDFLNRMRLRREFADIAKYGEIGVAALNKATPFDTHETANSWYYEIVDKPGYFAIHWCNSKVEEPGTIPVAVLIQYGHATGNGGYVQGIDYINPALHPIFDQIAADMWKEVTR